MIVPVLQDTKSEVVRVWYVDSVVQSEESRAIDRPVGVVHWTGLHLVKPCASDQILSDSAPDVILELLFVHNEDRTECGGFKGRCTE